MSGVVSRSLLRRLAVQGPPLAFSGPTCTGDDHQPQTARTGRWWTSDAAGRVSCACGRVTYGTVGPR